MLVFASAGFVGQEVCKGKQKESMQQHVWPKMASLPMTYDFSTFYFFPRCHTSILLYLVFPTHNSDPIPNPEVFCHHWICCSVHTFLALVQRELSLVISIIKRTNLNVPQYVQYCCMPRVMIATCTCGSCLFSHKWIHLWPAAITGKWAPVSGEGDRWKPSLTLSESLGYYKHSPNTMRVTELL